MKGGSVGRVSLCGYVSMSTRTLLMPLPILAEPVGGLAHRFAPSLFSGGRVSVALTAAWRRRRLAERRANAAEALCSSEQSTARVHRVELWES